jgi:3-deoxy-D-manno-octulosonate 8-phosphate phosphatase (KDO 8-P phosphatase)
MEERLRKIKAFAFDVDGVLTDGGLLADLHGEFYRIFNAKDGMALRMASMCGYPMAIITGGRSESIRKRFMASGIDPDDIYLNSRDKMEDFRKFCSRHSLSADEVMYFGDDLPDIPVMTSCGCGACPSDAVDEVKSVADIIGTRPGGKGFAREMLELVMKLQNTWHLDIDLYKKKF